MNMEVQADEGECYHTPRGSEVDTLEYYNDVALWLYIGNCTGRIGKWCSYCWQQQLGTIPGAGEYYRALVRDHPLHDVALMRYGAFLAGQAAREHAEKFPKGKARHGSQAA